jgi:hypothetical protein
VRVQRINTVAVAAEQQRGSSAGGGRKTKTDEGKRRRRCRREQERGVAAAERGRGGKTKTSDSARAHANDTPVQGLGGGERRGNGVVTGWCALTTQPGRCVACHHHARRAVCCTLLPKRIARQLAASVPTRTSGAQRAKTEKQQVAKPNSTCTLPQTQFGYAPAALLHTPHTHAASSPSSTIQRRLPWHVGVLASSSLSSLTCSPPLMHRRRVADGAPSDTKGEPQGSTARACS